jgi:plastocyanin domain-containing protein
MKRSTRIQRVVVGLVAGALVLFIAACPVRADKTIQLVVTANGFEPKHIKVKRGEPVTLVFTRKVEMTCAKDVVIDLGDGEQITKDLPINTPVSVEATFKKAGELTYQCSMNMIGGKITVR